MTVLAAVAGVNRDPSEEKKAVHHRGTEGTEKHKMTNRSFSVPSVLSVVIVVSARRKLPRVR